MRLIDADKLLADFKKHYFDNETVIRCAEIAISNAPTVYEWIPVTERKPTHDGYFLGTLKSGNVGTVSYSPTRGRFWLSGYYCDVIAWMELPEGYKK